MNVIILAYLGDAVYELYIRQMLLGLGFQNVDQLQKESVKYVSAKNQWDILKTWINNGCLTENELDIVYKARNNKRKIHPKNTDIVTYKYATGMEALIGYLYMNDKKRLYELLEKIEMR